MSKKQERLERLEQLCTEAHKNRDFDRARILREKIQILEGVRHYPGTHGRCIHCGLHHRHHDRCGHR